MSGDTKTLVAYPPGMTASEVEEATGLTEHSRRQAEADGLLAPISLGRKKVYPRWQVFAMLGMTDPDMAAAEAARTLVMSETETPPEGDAPNLSAPISPARDFDAADRHCIASPGLARGKVGA